MGRSYFEIAVCYASLFLAAPVGSFRKPPNASCESLYFSWITVTRTGYGDIVPTGILAAVLCMSVFCGRRIIREYRGFSEIWGTADVVLACVLAAMVFAVMVAAHGKISRQAEDATYRAYRILTHGIFVMLVVFFLAGERIIWINCLTRFGWRAWLLLYALPSWFTVVRAPAAK